MSTYDFSDVYEGLKDFQLATVDYAFQRMYLDDPPTRRFLIADEVGLGKTLVARGIIARTVEELVKRDVPRIDVVYICSNANIAEQNIRRLSLPKFEDFAFSTRLTMLPLELRSLSKSRLNFIAFTPGTSLDLKSNLGHKEERALLYWLVKKKWPNAVGTKQGPKRFFQGTVSSLANFDAVITRMMPQLRRIDRDLLNRFGTAIDAYEKDAVAKGMPTLLERFVEMARIWAHEREHPWAERRQRNLFIGELRSLLARTCVDALEPDLIILDEFQRFRHLLEGETPDAELAHSMFDWGNEHNDARVLLLSATPYKMYTLDSEADGDDHYRDFERTVSFLANGDMGSFRKDLHSYRSELLQPDFDRARLTAAKQRIESHLRKVMARTERLAATDDRNGMLADMHSMATDTEPDDLVASVNLQRAAEALEAGSVIEYWKSAPYFANFWNDYKIGQTFTESFTDSPATVTAVRRMLRPGTELIDWDAYDRYQPVDPRSARLRKLLADTVGQGAWKLLWLPPSLPYYLLEAPFESDAARGLTKRLVFSAWNAVPRAISSLMSYEAERRMMTYHKKKPLPNTTEGRERFAEPLRFPKKGTAMTSFALIYPSPSLARYADPLAYARLCDEAALPRTLEGYLRWAERELMRRLRRHLPKEGPVDDRWYWAAPLVLDREMEGQRKWLSGKAATERWTGPKPLRPSAGFAVHVANARQVDRKLVELGRPPEDLGEVLALLAVGGLGTVALRALSRITPKRRSECTAWDLRVGAARIAWGLRSLFNTPEATNLVRGLRTHGPYWRRVLEYAARGCLQSVLDEYVHVSRDWLGMVGEIDEADAIAIAASTADVVSMRSADVRGRDPLADPDDNERRMRMRFALPFGQQRSDEAPEIRRAGFVRGAFNSPFWPFVLTTTSVGQEGLDFHLYCHAVVHWNLPSNPVDLEQREGRVHRYMGHAVRKNLAAAHGSAAFSAATRDPWATMVEAAVAAREPGVSDLVPFWVFEGPAQIERHVPSMPLSREIGRLEDLQQSLALYRMVFGQPRQEELLAYLRRTGADEAMAEELRIDLSPRMSP